MLKTWYLPFQRKVFKARTGISSGIPSSISYHGSTAYTSKHKTDMFNSFFSSVFNNPIGNLENPTGNLTTVTLWKIDDLAICDDVAKVLSALDVKEACCPDGISSKIVKECANELSHSLAGLFNYTLRAGKVANVVPTFKSGERSLAANYRPISLTCIVVKVIERLIHQYVMKFLIDLQLLCANQRGFRKWRSCITQLLQLVHNWLNVLNKRESVDAVFLDFTKALTMHILSKRYTFILL